jgi:hypothetical protein
MLASTLSAILATSIAAVSAQNASVCQAQPFRALSCLTDNDRAANICSRLPNATTTVTSTTSVLSVITSAASAPLVWDQVTVNITSFETSTVTVTAYVWPTCSILLGSY